MLTDPYGLQAMDRTNKPKPIPSFIVILTYYESEMKRKNIRKGGGEFTGADNVFHCVAACKAKKSGNDVDLIRMAMNRKENYDYVKGRFGLYGDGRARNHDEMTADNDHDKAVNEVGLSCPSDKSCEAQCEPYVKTMAPGSKGMMREYLNSPEYRKY